MKSKMDEQVATFLAVTGAKDEATARQFLEVTNNDLEYAVTLYMESNQGQTSTSRNDEEFAARLQHESYGGQDDNIREADTNIHRHETLVDNYERFFSPLHQQSRPTDIFGRGRVGIFNQRFDDEENQYLQDRFEELEDEDEDEDEHAFENGESDNIMTVDSDDEDGQEPRFKSRRRINRDSRFEELNSTQRRLANLFRPPFDVMAKIDIDTAKVEGRREKKWILVNIQDSSEFSCQVLNRDFWSNSRVKAEIKRTFIFVQYQNDSPNGISYLQFYSTEKFPHIAILDPLTGERVFQWPDGEIPDIDTWLTDVEDFLTKFTVSPDKGNPIVKHPVKFDPHALTEEQQIEYAMKQSMKENEGVDADNAINVSDSEDQQSNSEPTQHEDPLDRIQPIDHPEPISGATTRVQIRFPNGKRIVRKLSLNDSILKLYQVLKHVISQDPKAYGLSSASDRFFLSNMSEKSFSLIDALDETIEGGNLKNSSLLLEKD